MKIYKFPVPGTYTLHHGYTKLAVVDGKAEVDEGDPAMMELVKRYGGQPAPERVKPLKPKPIKQKTTEAK